MWEAMSPKMDIKSNKYRNKNKHVKYINTIYIKEVTTLSLNQKPCTEIHISITVAITCTAIKC